MDKNKPEAVSVHFCGQKKKSARHGVSDARAEVPTSGFVQV